MTPAIATFTTYIAGLHRYVKNQNSSQHHGSTSHPSRLPAISQPTNRPPTQHRTSPLCPAPHILPHTSPATTHLPGHSSHTQRGLLPPLDSPSTLPTQRTSSLPVLVPPTSDPSPTDPTRASASQPPSICIAHPPTVTYPASQPCTRVTKLQQQVQL